MDPFDYLAEGCGPLSENQLTVPSTSDTGLKMLSSALRAKNHVCFVEFIT